MENWIEAIRSTTQIWVVTRHQLISGISALVSQIPFGGETSGSVAKCWLFSQAISIQAEIQKVNITVSSQIRDFKIQWCDRNENFKKNSRFNKQNNTFACASCLFVYFLVVTAWLWCENAEISCFMENVSTSNEEILFLSLNLDMVHWNSTSGGFPYISQNT